MKLKLHFVLKNDGSFGASGLPTGYFLRNFQVIFTRSDFKCLLPNNDK